ncbi:MAG: alpha/beta hydrolase, partial [Pseudomonadota bacterium]
MTPLVLLPGFMCDARLFAPQVAVLSRTRDVRTPVPIGSSMAAMAASVLADAPDQFALAGLSMGGILALEVLAQAPDRVARLAILDGTHRADAPANYDVRTR